MEIMRASVAEFVSVRSLFNTEPENLVMYQRKTYSKRQIAMEAVENYWRRCAQKLGYKS